MLIRTKNASRRTRLIAGLAAIGLVVAACGNSGDDDEADDEPVEDTTPETTTPAEPAEDTTPETTAPAEPAEDTAPQTTAPETTTPETTAPAEPAGPELGEFVSIEGVPGVTDEQIGFGLVATGPANPLGYCLLECYAQGVEAYFDYRNGLGGVNGRELALTQVLDDQLGEGPVKALELAGSDDVFGAFYAPIIANAFGEFTDAGMPVYSVFAASPEADDLENVYIPSGQLCLDCPRPHDVLAAQLAGATKVAALGFGVSQASKDCVDTKRQAFEKWGETVGIEFVYANDLLEFGLPSGAAPEVTAMGDAGVDFILTCMDQNSALIVQQELERQGMTDTKMQLNQGYGDYQFFADNADLLEGDLLGNQLIPLEANPADTMLSTMLEFTGDLEIVNDFTVQGWVGADLAVEGLLAAGPEFDRASVIAATNEITDWTGGGLLPPVDWSRQHAKPNPDDPSTLAVYDCFAYLEVTNGELEVVGSADEPFYCFDPPVEEWTEPTQMSFS